ncbi:MAG: polysaccharide deacetylase family protein [Clostridia bacterium]|nr:polysaccharide deacetylase family protein [Clostridia bacterium]
MKKVFCVIVCVLILLLLCSCHHAPAVSDTSGTDRQTTTSRQAETTTSGETKSKTTTTQTTQTVKETKPTPVITTTITSTAAKVTTLITTATTKPATTPPQTSTTAKQGLPPLMYTVNDAENTRGLATERKGFSFGVAQNGVPHSQSVINQQTFDAYENVQALALDTKSQDKRLYLTFDNGYEYQNLTADILDTLKKKQVKAAFFVTLSYVKKNPQFVQRMIDEGHIVGNHSTTHPSFPKLTRAEMAQEIATLDNYLREHFSYTSPYFRFPSGEHSECALELVTSIGFRSVFWSIAHSDWDTAAQKGADHAFSTVTSRFHPGAVILLHAVSKDNADALDRIIDEARRQGYTFKTLDEYFG